MEDIPSLLPLFQVQAAMKTFWFFFFFGELAGKGEWKKTQRKESAFYSNMAIL